MFEANFLMVTPCLVTTATYSALEPRSAYYFRVTMPLSSKIRHVIKARDLEDYGGLITNESPFFGAVIRGSSSPKICS